MRELRKYTERVLDRYYELEAAGGRPSTLCGRELFRAAVNRSTVTGMEERVIFFCDIERCLQRLNARARKVIHLVRGAGMTQAEAAWRMKCSLRTVIRCYGAALDRLTRVFAGLRLVTFPGLTVCEE